MNLSCCANGPSRTRAGTLLLTPPQVRVVRAYMNVPRVPCSKDTIMRLDFSIGEARLRRRPLFPVSVSLLSFACGPIGRRIGFERDLPAPWRTARIRIGPAVLPKAGRLAVAEPDVEVLVSVDKDELAFGRACRGRQRHVPQIFPSRQEYGAEGEICPEKTIPIRRMDAEILRNFRSLDDFFRKHPPHVVDGPTNLHQYAHAYRSGDNWGAQSILNVWGPYTERASEFSLSQIWVVRGSGRTRETIKPAGRNTATFTATTGPA